MTSIDGIYTRCDQDIADLKAAARKRVESIYAELDRGIRARRRERDAEANAFTSELLGIGEAA